MDKIIKHSKEYNKVHYSLRAKYGKANRCDFKDTCSGISKNYEWALKKGRDYSDNSEDYYNLCKSCHVKYDFKGVTEKNKKRMSELGKSRKGKEPHNKGNDSRITLVCSNCSNDFKHYKYRKYCSEKCSGKSKKQVINIKTNIIYNGVKEASEKENIKRSTLTAQLNGQNPNKTDLRYIL